MTTDEFQRLGGLCIFQLKMFFSSFYLFYKTLKFEFLVSKSNEVTFLLVYTEKYVYVFSIHHDFVFS